MYYVTKTYGHDLGLSACFRQWRAQSHCRFLHGYPLSFKLTFAADVLDENNWVLDFGGLKQVKAWLVDNFDHKLLVAQDDPARGMLEGLGERSIMHPPGEHLADVRIVPFVGCEGFAQYVFAWVAAWLADNHSDACRPVHGGPTSGRGLRLVSVEVREHGGNSAIFEGTE